jgi:hypothetical protein
MPNARPTVRHKRNLDGLAELQRLDGLAELQRLLCL